MRFLEVIVGIITFPFSWMYERFFKGSPSSPAEFWIFMKELRDRGVKGRLQMQASKIEGTDSTAIIVLEGEPSRMKVINLFRCDSTDVAQQKLREIESNDIMSHGKRRDRYLVSITFMDPEEELAKLVIASFDKFDLPANRSLDRTR